MLDGDTLKNKANIWTSNDRWKFQRSHGQHLIKIENSSNSRVLEMNTDNFTVSEKTAAPHQWKQQWLRKQTDSDGYFRQGCILQWCAIEITH